MTKFSGMVPYFLRLLAVSIIFAASCSRDPKPEASLETPVLLITVDTLRSDHLPAYGYDKIETPAIDAFREDAVLYEHAFAHVPLTLPSHSSIMTGLLPYRHGARGNVGYVLDEKPPTLAARFKKAGYTTGAVVSSMVLRRSVGLVRGFDYYDDAMKERDDAKLDQLSQREGKVSIAVARAWLEREADRPFFLWLHLFEPHSPYDPPEPYASGSPSPYDGEIVYTDTLLSGLFAYLKEKGLYDRALIVLASDHGEGLGDHGEKEHGTFLYRETIQVPLMIKWPNGYRSGGTVSQNVGLVDLAPTIAGTVGLAPLEGDGIDLSRSVNPPASRIFYAESLFAEDNYGWHRQTSVIEKNMHYIRGYEPELYDLEKDFTEKDNLIASRRVPGSMVSFLDEVGEGAAARQSISDQDREMLASLGYTGSFTGGDILAMTADELIFLAEEINQCRALINQGRHAEAEPRLVALLEQFPTVLDARLFLTGLLRNRGEAARAEHLLMEGLVHFPEDPGLLTALADIELRLDKTEAAVRIGEKAVKRDPLLAGKNLLEPFFERGLLPLSEVMARAMVEDGAAHGYPYYVLGRITATKGRPDQAAPLLEKAADLFSEPAQKSIRVAALVFLAECRLALNQQDRAAKTLETALELDPGRSPTRVLMAEVLSAGGRFSKARDLLEEGLARSPDDAALMSASFALALMEGNTEKAADMIGPALKADPGQAAPLIYNSVTTRGTAALADRAAREMLSHEPSKPHGALLLGRLAHQKRALPEALRLYRQAEKQWSETGDADPQMLGELFFFMGDCTAGMGDPRSAEHYFQRAVGVDPGDPNARVALTNLYARLGNREAAKQNLVDWLTDHPSPHHFRVAAQVLRELGYADLAETYENRADIKAR